MSKVEVICAKTADDFVRILRDKEYTTAEDSIFNPNRWIFRGQANFAWGLQPSAHRSPIKESLLYRAGRVGSISRRLETTLIFSEYMILFRFMKGLERYGLPIPDNGPEVRDFFAHPSKLAGFLYQSSLDEKLSWPPSCIHGLMAQAQHHRIPTRLLDWTYDPLVACYFAAKQPLGESIAVWCLDTATVTNNKSHVSLINAVAESNSNLKAQNGLFLCRRSYFSDADFDRDECVEPIENDSSIGSVSEGRSPFFKVVLPAGEVSALRSILKKSSYTTARLFPGYDGLVDELNEDPSPFSVGVFDYKGMNCNIHIFIPGRLYQLGNAIAALLDPDTGGHLTFRPPPFQSEFSYCGGQLGTESLTYLLRDLAFSIPGFKYHIFGGPNGEIFDTNIAGAMKFGESKESLERRLI